MRKLICLFLLSSSFLANAQYDNTDLKPYLPIDSCHTLFDIPINDSLDCSILKLTIDELYEIDTLWAYKSFCGTQQLDTIYCQDFRLFIVPKNGPPAMITGVRIIRNSMKTYFSTLQVGDRVIIDGMNYKESEASRPLRPLIIHIVD